MIILVKSSQECFLVILSLFIVTLFNILCPVHALKLKCISTKYSVDIYALLIYYVR